jgi:hypothetical protein
LAAAAEARLPPGIAFAFAVAFAFAFAFAFAVAFAVVGAELASARTCLCFCLCACPVLVRRGGQGRVCRLSAALSVFQISNFQI